MKRLPPGAGAPAGRCSLCEIAILPVVVGPLSAPVPRADPQFILPGYDAVCIALFIRGTPVGVVMSRYLAPVGFALAATWVAVLFYLVGAH
jgi:hypothetical protein